MFEKPFQLLNRAVDRIETQLEQADVEQKSILGEELIALRNVCDKFVENWLSFEERVAGISEKHHLDLDGTLPTPELQDMQEKLAKLQNIPLPTSQNDDFEDEDVEEAKPESAPPVKKSQGSLTYVVGDGISLRPNDELMVRSFRRGLGYFDLLMFPESMEEFKRVIEIDGKFTIARLYIAFGYLAQEQYDDALEQLDLLNADEQEDDYLIATIRATYGHIYAARAQYEDAIVEFQATARLIPDFRDINFNIACAHYNLKQYKEALTFFQRQLVLSGEDWEAHRFCGLLWAQQGARERGYRHMARAYDINGANEQVILEFAHLSERMGEREQARALYKKALRYFPTSPQAYGGLGWLKMRDGDTAEAFALFKKQLSCKPSDRQGIFNIGWAAYQTKDYKRAEASFTQLLQGNSRDVYALAGLARTWSQTGKVAEAKEQLLQLVAMEGADEKKLGLYHLGRLALEEAAYKQALRYFNSALIYDRNCVESLFYKGVSHYALGEQERAELCFEKCKMHNMHPQGV